MTSNEIKEKLERLGLKKTGDKAALESFLALAEKMNIPSDTKVVEIHPQLPEDTQLEIRSIDEISKAFPAITSSEDLQTAVELRFNRIALAKDLANKWFRIDEQDIELQLSKNSLSRSRTTLQLILNPLEQADKFIEQRMIEYDQINQTKQDENRDGLVTMIAEQANKDIKERAELLVDDGRMKEATELLATLDDNPVSLYLPESENVKTKVEGASFTSRFKWELKSIKDVNKEFLRPQVENRGLIGKVVTREGFKAEQIVGGIKVIKKPGVRKGKPSSTDDESNDVILTGEEK